MSSAFVIQVRPVLDVHCMAGAVVIDANNAIHII